MLSDIKIAQKAEIKPIKEIAEKAGIEEKYLELYGNYKAKVSLDILKKLQDRPYGKYIDVTAITPTRKNSYNHWAFSGNRKTWEKCFYLYKTTISWSCFWY